MFCITFSSLLVVGRGSMKMRQRNAQRSYLFLHHDSLAFTTSYIGFKVQVVRVRCASSLKVQAGPGSDVNSSSSAHLVPFILLY